MKTTIDVKPGAFTAEGSCLEPAQITLVLFDLELQEYQKTMSVLTKEFDVDYKSTVFRHNRDVIVKGNDSMHDGGNPHEGDRTRL
jgi:hypothetical protein